MPPSDPGRKKKTASWRERIYNQSTIDALRSLPYSIVLGTTARYGLDGPGIETRWTPDFLHPSRPALGPTQPPIQWVPGLFLGGNADRLWRSPPTPLYNRGQRKSRDIPLFPFWAFMACSYFFLLPNSPFTTRLVRAAMAASHHKSSNYHKSCADLLETLQTLNDVVKRRDTSTDCWKKARLAQERVDEGYTKQHETAEKGRSSSFSVLREEGTPHRQRW
jgi:hypothetical protein